MNCPSCGITMKTLLFSEYCPNDCDRKTSSESKSIELKWNSELWKMAIVKENEPCPSWATHRWWIWETDWDLEHLVKHWGLSAGPFEIPGESPGWVIASRVDGARTDHSLSAVFCKVIKNRIS